MVFRSICLAADLDLLTGAFTTLDEQLRHVRPHKTQPTFYLTIISVGQVEALEDSRDAFERRVGTLVEFLDQARGNLFRIPVLCKELGLEMLPKLEAWVAGLALADSRRRKIGAALDRYGDHLRRAAADSDFRPGKKLYERITDRHMTCRMGLSELAWHLYREIGAAANQLSASAEGIDPDKLWQSVSKSLPPPTPADFDVAAHETYPGHHLLDSRRWGHQGKTRFPGFHGFQLHLWAEEIPEIDGLNFSGNADSGKTGRLWNATNDSILQRPATCPPPFQTSGSNPLSRPGRSDRRSN